jgi:predicted protein tyrosine phosphatase
MVDIEATDHRMKRVLFICGKGRQRSPTAESVFTDIPDWETDSAGLSADADVLISPEQIEWASDIAVMEKRQLARLRQAFPKHVAGRRIVYLDISDDFYMQPELIELLKQRIGRIA